MRWELATFEKRKTTHRLIMLLYLFLWVGCQEVDPKPTAEPAKAAQKKPASTKSEPLPEFLVDVINRNPSPEDSIRMLAIPTKDGPMRYSTCRRIKGV